MARGIKVKMISGSQSATGSFTQLLFSGSTTCPRIEFGNLVNPVDNGNYNLTTKLKSLSHGTYLDGPIAKFSVAADGGVIAYYHEGTLINVQ